MRTAQRVLIVATALAVTSASQARAQLPTWKLSPAPTLTIGTEGDAQKEFQQITGMARASNGNIVVLNEGSHNFRVFDTTGKFLRAYGRQGAGPGEFEYIRLLGRSGDSLFVFDPRYRRVSLVSLNDGYKSVRVLPTAGDQASLRPTARLTSGAILALPIAGTNLQHPDGVYRDSIRPAIVAAPPSQATEQLGIFPFMSYFAYNPNYTERAMSVGVYRFGNLSYFTASGDAVWFGNSDSKDIQIFDHSGKVVSHAKVPWDARPFNETSVSKAQAAAVSNAANESSKAYMRALYAAKYRPKFEPLFGSLVAGAEGGVWIARFNADQTSPTEYAVMDRTGKGVARITLPARFTPQEIGKDYVLGIARAEDGIETVAVYQLLH